MKLWEMLRDAEIGDRYKCVSIEESWNGAIYQIHPTSQGYCIKREHDDSPSPYLIDLCQAAINADWVKLTKPVIQVPFECAYEAFKNGISIKPVSKEYIYDPNICSAFLIEDIEDMWIILNN